MVEDQQGQIVWRKVDEMNLVYTVDRRAWLGSFTPEQCRGALNYKDNSFQISYLPIGALPTSAMAVGSK